MAQRTRTGDHRTPAALRRGLSVLRDLMAGAEHDRRSIAEQYGIEPAAADDIIVGLLRGPGIPGVVSEQHGRRKVLKFAPRAEPAPKGAEVPPLAAVLAACIGASLARVFRGSPYEQGLRDARDFLLQASRRRDMADLERKFIFVQPGGEWALPERGSDLRTLVGAILDLDYVKFAYRHNNGRTETLRAAPLSLAIFGHQIYMISRRPDGSFYPYRFSRISSLEVLDEPSFSYPTKDDYNPEDLFRRTFGIFIAGEFPIADVEVKLTGSWASFARTHRWHPNQRIIDLKDGVLVQLERIRVCPEVEAWILGFGAQAEVVGPEWLRAKVSGIAQDMVSKYAEPARDEQSSVGRAGAGKSPKGAGGAKPRRARR